MNAEKVYHILLIEDNPGDARLIKEYLKEPSIQFQPSIEVEVSIQAGFNRLQEREFDVVLLDLSLPDSFGLETFEKVSSASGSVPIIVLTGLDDENIGVEAVHLGAQDFLIKKEINAQLLGRSILYAIQRNRLSKKLRENQKRLKEAQRLAKLGNFEQDLRTNKLTWSDEIFRTLELDPDDETPDYAEFRNMIYPEDRYGVDKAIVQVRQHKKQQYVEFRVNTRKGNTKYLNSILTPIENSRGEVESIFGTSHDITQVKKTEEQLRESEQRYRVLFQSTSDEILVFQVDGNKNPLPFMEVNSVACDILNYSREDLLKKTIYDIDAADKKEVDKRIEHILRNKEVTQESRYQTKDGIIIPVEISARSFHYNGRDTIISIGRDIRERRKLEEEILKISDQERQRIGRDLHDSLGQMLTGIGLITQNLAQKLKSNELYGAEEVKDISDMIKEADEQARSLSRGLVPVNVESNGLNAALQELAGKTSKMYDIAINFRDNQISHIENNLTAIHLYRITQEAINNAVKHGQATAIDVQLSALGDHITLTVEDNGVGFSAQEVVSDGMGLRIMNFRTQIIRGSLEVQSEPGEGTKITCNVPKEDRK